MGNERDLKKAEKSLPTCTAMLLCDSVVRDDVTHKTNITGIFDTFCLESLPGQTSPCTIFLRFADTVDGFPIAVEVHDPTHGMALFRSSESGNPIEKTSGELGLPVAPLTFDQTGAYDMVVFAAGVEIGRIQFRITLRGS